MKFSSATGTYEPSESISRVVEVVGFTVAEPILVVSVALEAILGLKSIEFLKSNVVPELEELYLGICGVTIAVVFAVDSFGSITYESTEKNPIPDDTSCSK